MSCIIAFEILKHGNYGKVENLEIAFESLSSKWLPSCVLRSLWTQAYKFSNFKISNWIITWSQLGKLLHAFAHVEHFYLDKVEISSHFDILYINKSIRFSISYFTFWVKDASRKKVNYFIERMSQNESFRQSLKKFTILSSGPLHCKLVEKILTNNDIEGVDVDLR